MRRQNRSLWFQVILIFVIVIVAFWGSALFFAYLNTEAMRTSVETETNLSAVLLSSRVRAAARVELLPEDGAESAPELSESLDGVLSGLMYSARREVGEDLILQVVGRDGQVYYESAPENLSDGKWGASGERGLSGEQWEEAVKELDGTKDAVLLWLGDKSWFHLTQYLYLLRPVLHGKLYMIMFNPCRMIEANQRRQTAAFAAFGLLTTVVMIVLIGNTIAVYRKKLFRLAMMDELTDLANRKYFNDMYREHTEEKGEELVGNCSLFLMDIDYFKQINDTYGHAAGDLALKAVAEGIGILAEKVGGFAGRWGGDEFIGVLPMPGERALRVMTRFCRDVAGQNVKGGEFRITVSIGVAPFGEEPDLAGLSEKADKALYVAKENGRNQAVLYGQPGRNWESVGPEGAKTPAAAALRDAGAKTVEAESVLSEDAKAAAAGALHAAGERPAVPGAVPSGDAEFVPAAEAMSGGRDGSSEKGSPEPEGSGKGKRVSWRLRLFSRREKKSGGQRVFPTGAHPGGFSGKLLHSVLLGVHWMATFVAAGGIMIGAAFLLDAASVDLATLSVAERAQFGSITPLAGTLKSIGGTTMNFMLPIFAGFMAYGMAGEEAFMAGFVGGYMTIESRSGFIGAAVAGFAAGVIIYELEKFVKHMPGVVRKAAPIIIYPFFSLVLMEFISRGAITPAATAIGNFFTELLEATLGAGRPLAGMLAGGMMAVDMGGIVNKAAYNYGVEGLAMHREFLMASVMAGGMVPPLGIAFSVLLHPEKFTKQERGRLAGTAFMGLAFITEGVLPFVFSDVFRVIPCCIAGSALAGALSAAFGCTLPAPHGGVFVVPLMEHPGLYLLSIAAGSAVTGALYALWKRKPEAAPEKEGDPLP